MNTINNKLSHLTPLNMSYQTVGGTNKVNSYIGNKSHTINVSVNK